jgi:hypothetical protein
MKLERDWTILKVLLGEAVKIGLLALLILAFERQHRSWFWTALLIWLLLLIGLGMSSVRRR